MIDALLSYSAAGVSASSLTQNDHAPWLALRRVKGLGCVSFKKLAAEFADPRKIFTASRSALEQVEDLRADAIDGIVNFHEWAEVNEEICRARDAGISLVGYSAANYPERLRAIVDPPPLLYVKGELIGADEKAVAIVGSRSASDYGRRVARDLVVAYLLVTGEPPGTESHDQSEQKTRGPRQPLRATLHRGILACAG